MSAVTRFLIRVPVIIVSFVAMILVGLSFMPVMQSIDGPLLDTLLSGEAARARLAEMTIEQRYIHFLGTVVNDTLYPFAYGSFFAGLAGRFAPEKLRGWVMLPALSAAVIDLVENTVQALALYGSIDLLNLKDVLTPAKYGLFMLAAIIAIGFAAFALARWLVKSLQS
jgi:hypothetical protein